MRVPFQDLGLQHERMMPELQSVFREVTEAGAFSAGPYVERFEREFADYCQTRFAVGLGSGTEALWLSLLALGVGPGDEVITAPNSFMAVAEAISMCGARPVFVDVDEKTYTLDPGQLERAITLRTQAIIPVHLFGHVADMDAILAVARRHGTPVLEDACQAPGAEYHERRVGSLGTVGCFSFFPGGNLGAMGEAGGITTDDGELVARVEELRNHGQSSQQLHSSIGWNARMDGLQAAILSLKLKRLAGATAARQRHAALYDRLLAGEPAIGRPVGIAASRHVFHVYAVRVASRDEVVLRMAERGVQCGVHYPIPIHLQKAYSFLEMLPGSLPVTERLARELISLPLYPELEPEQVQHVTESLKASLARPVAVPVTVQLESRGQSPAFSGRATPAEAN